MKRPKQKLNSLQFKIICYFSCVFCFINRLFVYMRMRMSASKQQLRECLRAGLPQGIPSTAPPPVHVSAVLGTLAVWIPNPPPKKKTTGSEVWVQTS